MRVTRELSLNLIDVDRLPIGLRTLALVKHLENGGTVPPIHVQVVPAGRFRILDGRHRMLAFRLMERRKIRARYGVPDVVAYGVGFTLFEGNKAREISPWEVCA